jgi:hypothetical protein
VPHIRTIRRELGRWRLVLFAGVVTLCGCVDKQAAVEATIPTEVLIQAVADSPPSSMLVDERRNLGDFLEDEIESLECRFEVKNTESRPLKIVELVPSCGCLEARLQSKEVGPNESTWLLLSGHIQSFFNHGRVVECVLHDDAGGRRRYAFEARVFPKFSLLNDRLYFGYVEPDQQAVLRTEVYAFVRADDPSPPEFSVRTSHPRLRVSLEGPVETWDVSEIFRRFALTVKVEMQPVVDVDSPGGELQVACTRSGEELTKPIAVYWGSRPIFDVQPNRVFLTAESADFESALSQTVVVTRHDGEPFTITRATCKARGVVVDCELDSPKASHEVAVSVRRETLPVYGALRLEVDQPKFASVVIPISAIK